jgi:hypothetical protein
MVTVQMSTGLKPKKKFPLIYGKVVLFVLFGTAFN